MDLAQTLKIHKTQEIFQKYLEFTKAKLISRVESEINAENASELPIQRSQMTKKQNDMYVLKLEKLKAVVKIEFNEFEPELNVLSPEDKQEKKYNEAMVKINQCKNLNDFYDVLFLIDDTLIKGNSLILRARSPYF